MMYIPSREALKKSVKRAHEYSKEKGHKIKLSFFYEVASIVYGVANWDTFSALLERSDKQKSEMDIIVEEARKKLRDES